MKERVGTCRNVESMDILPTLRYFSNSPHFNRELTLYYRDRWKLTCNTLITQRQRQHSTPFSHVKLIQLQECCLPSIKTTFSYICCFFPDVFSGLLGSTAEAQQF